LFDINVLLALFDLDHLRHKTAQDWILSEVNSGWATCPITENGFIRIISQASYPNPVSTPVVACHMLKAATDAEHHIFWPDDISVLNKELINEKYLIGHRQITDIYLLALAVKHGGRLITFDRRISTEAVVGASPSNLVVLS
jgi:toxin-antitoxin system PIN domain toxin